MSANVAEIIEKKFFAKLKEKKGEFSGTVVLDITGDGGGQWTLDLDNSTIEKKDSENPTVRIKMIDEDFIAMINGDLNPAAAMFGGKLKIEGDMAMASKLAMAIQ